MNNHIHVVNGAYGFAFTFVCMLVASGIGYAIFPVLERNGIRMDGEYLFVLLLFIILGFQFLLCFLVSRQCEIMMRDSQPDIEAFGNGLPHD